MGDSPVSLSSLLPPLPRAPVRTAGRGPPTSPSLPHSTLGHGVFLRLPVDFCVLNKLPVLVFKSLLSRIFARRPHVYSLSKDLGCAK